MKKRMMCPRYWNKESPSMPIREITARGISVRTMTAILTMPGSESQNSSG